MYHMTGFNVSNSIIALTETSHKPKPFSPKYGYL